MLSEAVRFVFGGRSLYYYERANRANLLDGNEEARARVLRAPERSRVRQRKHDGHQPCADARAFPNHIVRAVARHTLEPLMEFRRTIGNTLRFKVVSANGK